MSLNQCSATSHPDNKCACLVRIRFVSYRIVTDMISLQMTPSRYQKYFCINLYCLIFFFERAIKWNKSDRKCTPDEVRKKKNDLKSTRRRTPHIVCKH
jgi:hypothetical protein